MCLNSLPSVILSAKFRHAITITFFSLTEKRIMFISNETAHNIPLLMWKEKWKRHDSLKNKYKI